MERQVQPRERTVTVNGLRIHFLEWGAAGKQPVILLHGLRGHAHCWDDFSEAMGEDHHVFALDQRGRGESDWAKDGDYSTEAFVSDLAAFCEELKPAPFILVGHSMGGRNSMAFTAKYPERVRRLIIVDVGPTLDPRGRARMKEEMDAAPEEFESFEAVVKDETRLNRYASDSVLRRRMKYSTEELPNGKFKWKYDLAVRDQMRKGTGAAPLDLWPEVPKITCPTLLVRGADTDVLGEETARQMLERIPKAELVTIASAGHMVFEDNPDAFNTAVRGWLK